MASSSQDANNHVADAVQVSAEEDSSSGPSLEIDVGPTSPWWGQRLTGDVRATTAIAHTVAATLRTLHRIHLFSTSED